MNQFLRNFLVTLATLIRPEARRSMLANSAVVLESRPWGRDFRRRGLESQASPANLVSATAQPHASSGLLLGWRRLLRGRGRSRGWGRGWGDNDCGRSRGRGRGC